MDQLDMGDYVHFYCLLLFLVYLAGHAMEQCFYLAIEEESSTMPFPGPFILPIITHY